VVGNPEAEMGAPRRHRSSLALLVLVGMIAALVWGGLPVVVVTLIAALAMTLFGCLPVTDMYEAIDWKSVVLIAGMLPMSIAMEKVGLVNVAAAGLVNWLGVYDWIFCTVSLLRNRNRNRIRIPLRPARPQRPMFYRS